jgi:hypothetical protein
MVLPPIYFLLGLIALTIAVPVALNIAHKPYRRVLQELARRWHLAYSPSDRFRLADRIAGSFPVPGAAALRVGELIYGSQGDRYRYLFVVEYTLGIVTGKRRVRRVATFSEAKDAGSAAVTQLDLADETLPLARQFEALLARTCGPDRA